MKLYIAGASSEAQTIAQAIQTCREAGIVITHDWTRSVLEHWGQPDSDLLAADRREFARDDFLGVSLADVVWLRVPSAGSAGSWVELGIALGLCKTVLVSGDAKRSIFCELADVFCATHEEALDLLLTKMP